MSEEKPAKKRVFLYGQWVDVIVLPAVSSPDPDVTVHSTNKSRLSSVDTTVFDTPVKHRDRRKPTLH